MFLRQAGVDVGLLWGSAGEPVQDRQRSVVLFVPGRFQGCWGASRELFSAERLSCRLQLAASSPLPLEPWPHGPEQSPLVISMR